MNLHWLLPCTHLVFVIDRIEHSYAVIEWAHTAMLEDVPQTEFPTKPREGQIWTVHIKRRLPKKTHPTGFDWTLMKENQKPLQPKLRLIQAKTFQQHP